SSSAKEPSTDRQVARWRQEYAELENTILALEGELDLVTEKMAQPEVYADGALIRETSLRHRAIVDELEELYQRWEGLLEQMESRNLTL
ncbi:MAG: hypothetical protein GX322_06980, partial [Firmicutes bacterium]|nr:hypothetical protein [Bacillota bacterium]